MYIFFHHIGSWMVGEGQEWRGGGNATWEVVSVSKSKLLGDILQHNHPLCLCSSAHMAHIQPVTLNHCYFLTYINKNKPNFRFSMWGKMLLEFSVKRPEAALKIIVFVRSSLWRSRLKKKKGPWLTAQTHVLLMEYSAKKSVLQKKLCPRTSRVDTALAVLTNKANPPLST